VSQESFIRQNYRIYPTKEQQKFLNQDMGNQRFIWNYFLGKSIERYELEKKFYFFIEMTKQLPDMKKDENFAFLKLGGSQSLQVTCETLSKALSGSFKSTKNTVRKGFPKFKKKTSTGSVVYPQKVKLVDGKLRIPKLKSDIKIVGGYDLPEKYFSVTITRSTSGQFYASFVVPTTLPDKIQINANSKAVGIDLNSQHIMVLDDGSAVVNPKHLLEKEKRLKRYQRAFSRKQKGSSNKNKARVKLAKLHEKVANSRKDFVEKLTLDVVKNNDIIVIEDLNVKAMQKWNGRMVQSAPFGMIRSKLTWKANKLGKHLVVINRFTPTSKVCSECGQIHEIDLSTRWLSCDCGASLHRDHNAAVNILNAGLQNIEAGTAFQACGETKVHDLSNEIRWVSLKQEDAVLFLA
jgi:putative transposase